MNPRHRRLLIPGLLITLLVVVLLASLIGRAGATTTSDGASEATVASKIEAHRPQMEAYRKAVSRMENVPLDRVRARLLFVTAGIGQFLNTLAYI